MTPKFENPPFVGYHSITIACGICMTLLVLFGAARFYSKFRLIRRITIDDCKCIKVVSYISQTLTISDLFCISLVSMILVRQTLADLYAAPSPSRAGPYIYCRLSWFYMLSKEAKIPLVDYNGKFGILHWDYKIKDFTYTSLLVRRYSNG